MPFHIGITRDFLKPDGSVGFGDIGLQQLASHPGVTWEFVPESHAELPLAVVDRYDALVVLGPRVTSATLDGCRRVSILARFGVGYDTVDIEACTRNDVLLTITPDGVRRPVASATMAFILALAHRLPAKDRLTREGRWAEKLDYCGVGLVDRTLGLIGLGNIGREIFTLAQPFEMRHVAFDPFATAESAASAGATLVSLEELLQTSDFVVVCCALTPQTRGLLDARRLALLKPSAFLINVARGPIVDQAALTAVLRERRIAGAALDVFEKEPIDADDPLLSLDNVIVAPHAVSWTDEMMRRTGQSALASILEVAAGRVPQYVVNRDVVARPGLLEKLGRYAALSAS